MKSIINGFGETLNRLGTTAVIKSPGAEPTERGHTHSGAVPRERKSIFNSRGRHPDEMVNFTTRLYAHSLLCRWSLESKIEADFIPTAYRVT